MTTVGARSSDASVAKSLWTLDSAPGYRQSAAKVGISNAAVFRILFLTILSDQISDHQPNQSSSNLQSWQNYGCR